MTDERVLAAHIALAATDALARFSRSDYWDVFARSLDSRLDAAGYVIVPKDEYAALERVRDAAAMLVDGYADQSEEGSRKMGRAYLVLVAALSDGGES